MSRVVSHLLNLITKALRRGPSPPSSASPSVIHLPPLSGPEAPVLNVEKEIIEAAIQGYEDMKRREEARADKEELKDQISELQRQISELGGFYKKWLGSGLNIYQDQGSRNMPPLSSGLFF